MKKYTLILFYFLFSQSISSQNHSDSKLNCFQPGEVKFISSNKTSNELLVVGKQFLHIYDLDNLYQVDLIKQFAQIKKAFFIDNDNIVIHSGYKIYSYNLSDYTQIQIGKDKGNVYDIHYDQKSKNLFTREDKNKCSIYALEKDSFILKQSIITPARVARIHHSKKFVGFGLNNGQIAIYSKSNYKHLYTLKGHSNKPINDLNFSLDGKYLISSIEKEEAILWNLENKKVAQKFSRETGFFNKVAIIDNQIHFANHFNYVISNLNGKTISSREVTEDEYILKSPGIIKTNGQIVYNLKSGERGEYLQYIIDKKFEEIKMPSLVSNQIHQLNYAAKNELIIIKSNELVTFNSQGNTNTKLNIISHRGFKIIRDGYAIGTNIKNMKSAPTFYEYSYSKAKTKLVEVNLDDFLDVYRQRCIKINNVLYTVSYKGVYNIKDSKYILNFTIEKDSSDIYQTPKDRIERGWITGTEYFYEYNPKNLKLNVRKYTGDIIKKYKNYQYVSNDKSGKLIVFDKTSNNLIDLDMNSFKEEILLKLKKKPNSLSYSPEKTWLCVNFNSMNNDVFLYNLLTNSSVKITPKSLTYTFLFTTNKDYLLTGTQHGEIEIWDLKSGIKRGGFLTTSGKFNEWALYFDEYFDGSKKGIEFLLNKQQTQTFTRKEGILKDIF